MHPTLATRRCVCCIALGKGHRGRPSRLGCCLFSARLLWAEGGAALTPNNSGKLGGGAGGQRAGGEERRSGKRPCTAREREPELPFAKVSGTLEGSGRRQWRGINKPSLNPKVHLLARRGKGPALAGARLGEKSPPQQQQQATPPPPPLRLCGIPGKAATSIVAPPRLCNSLCTPGFLLCWGGPFPSHFPSLSAAWLSEISTSLSL